MANARRALVAVGLLVAAVLPAASTASAAAPSFLDPTFGTAGVAAFDTSPQASVAYAIARQADGRILVGGSRAVDANRGQAVITRFLANGQVDTTFGTGGVFLFDNGNDTLVSSIAVGPEGKIVAAISDSLVDDTGAQVDLVQLDATGHLDPLFGNGGLAPVPVTVDFTANTSRSRVAVQGDGNIVVASNHSMSGFPLGPTDMVVSRFTPAGVPDAGFGTAGVAEVAFSAPGD